MPSARRKLGEIEASWELETTVEFYHVHAFHVKVEALQLQVQDRGELHKPDALLCTLLSIAFSLIKVVTVKHLIRSELFHGLLYGLEVVSLLALDVQLNVIKRFAAFGSVVDIEALDVVFHLAFEEPLDGAIHWSAFHLLLQSITQDPVQLLRIVLGECICGVPTKGLHQLLAVDSLLGGLQSVKDILQGLDQGDISFCVGVACFLHRRIFLLLAFDGVNDSPELSGMEEALQQTVHVARCAVVHQADISGFLPTVEVLTSLNTVSLSNTNACSEAKAVTWA
mmetsp:Transcript_9499/g.22726  ORF Transcript_9499/g.22726 Transcript_9499/m.22726 type:complete len:282 (-) Transcript_9499:207-1052(-)